MNKILFNYIIFNYLKVILKVTFLFYLFGMILNLFEEIEFFKGIDAVSYTHLTLPTTPYV